MLSQEIMTLWIQANLTQHETDLTEKCDAKKAADDTLGRKDRDAFKGDSRKKCQFYIYNNIFIFQIIKNI